ncbi:MAG: hypothetical protein VCE12_00095, partial [Candidatus Latescibacterota bacterium]
ECTDLAGEEDVECEVAIIGAGVTGLSAAYHMARDSGVAAGTGAGKLVASLVKGEATAQADIPLVMRSQPPKFPFQFLRTKYLRAAYTLYRIKDEYL